MILYLIEKTILYFQKALQKQRKLLFYAHKTPLFCFDICSIFTILIKNKRLTMKIIINKKDTEKGWLAHTQLHKTKRSTSIELKFIEEDSSSTENNQTTLAYSIRDGIYSKGETINGNYEITDFLVLNDNIYYYSRAEIRAYLNCDYYFFTYRKTINLDDSKFNKKIFTTFNHYFKPFHYDEKLITLKKRCIENIISECKYPILKTSLDYIQQQILEEEVFLEKKKIEASLTQEIKVKEDKKNKKI